MKVRELIADSVFIEGAARSGPAPRVTVILPTFRRGDDGLLRRAIDSLLGQSFDDLEIIVIDDANTDSTPVVLRDAMKRDPRISVIRHTRNIGLPAVSEYEAYIRARGDLIAFAFDDTVFYRHGIRRLVMEADRHPDTMISGFVKFFYRDGPDGAVQSTTLGQGTTESELQVINHVPNNGVMVPKSILDVVGLYDPHVSLARICDYDLWRRIRRYVPISFVSMCIGEEHGAAHSNSLGHTYVLDHWMADDRMRQHRNEQLTPAEFEQVDVFDVESFASGRSRDVVRALAEGHVSSRDWMTVPVADTASRRVPRIMVVASPIDASTQLVFEALRDLPDLHVRFVDPAHRNVGELAQADVLISSPEVPSDWTQLARWLGIPVFCYLDGIVIPDARARRSRAAGPPSSAYDALRAALEPLDGVLTSTEELAQLLRDEDVHSSVGAVPVTLPTFAAEIGRRTTAATSLAVYMPGGRQSWFRRTLWPALTAAAQRTGRPLRVLAPDAVSLSRRLRDPLVTLEPLPVHGDVFASVRDLRMAGVDVIVTVPRRGEVRHALSVPGILASILGATLLSDLEDEGAAEAITAALAAKPPRAVLPGVPPTEAASHLIAAVGARIPEREPDMERRVLRMADWLAYQLYVTRSMLNGSGGSSGSREVVPGFTRDLYEVVRRSRRLNAFRRSQTPLAIGGMSVRGAPTVGRGQRTELSVPLSAVTYASYAMTIPAGRLRRVRVLVVADGGPGDLLGLEIVDPSGRICLHTVTALPAGGEPAEVTFDVRKLDVSSTEPYEVRVFVRGASAAHVVEVVDRGRFGMRRPRATPVLRFDAG